MSPAEALARADRALERSRRVCSRMRLPGPEKDGPKFITGDRVVGIRRENHAPGAKVVGRDSLGVVVGWDAELRRYLVLFDEGPQGLQRVREAWLSLAEQGDLFR